MHNNLYHNFFTFFPPSMKKFLFTLISIIIIGVGYIGITYILPQTNNAPTTRLTYSGNGISFAYPETFSGNVWRPLSWPPVAKVVSLGQDPVSVGCPDMKNIVMQSWSTQGKTNNGLRYNMYQWTDIGAWQLYTLYCFVFPITIHSTNGCGNNNCWPYCGTPHEQECKDFDTIKEVIHPLTTLLSTFKLIQ